MKNKKTWLFGAIGGVIASIWFTITAISGSHPDFDMAELIGYTTMLLAFSMIFVGVKHRRDRQLGGAISFGKAFGTGFLIALIASSIYVLVWEIYFFTAGGDFIAEYAAYYLEQMRQSGVSEEQIAIQAAEMEQFSEMYKNPIVNILFTYMEILPLGAIIALIAALIFKRKQPKLTT